MAHFLAIGTVIVYGLPMEKILISACLMGEPVRYDGAAKKLHNTHLVRWQAAGMLLPVCPEIAGGFATPRLPAEIEPEATAMDVLQGGARILDSQGNDVTDGFLQGARATLITAKNANCRHAILMDGSPSCGSGFVYDGRFTAKRRNGVGVTTALLVQNGIQVWSASQIDDLDNALSLK